MNTRYYYNPIDCACKSVVGGVKAGEELQINLFYLKAEEIVEKLLVNNPSNFIEPDENAYLILAKDGQKNKYLPTGVISSDYTCRILMSQFICVIYVDWN